MLFGIFDGPHESHADVLTEAKRLGDSLIVVVAQDHVVRHITGQEPANNLAERFEHLQADDGVSRVVIGDIDTTAWRIVKQHQPDVVAFTANQEALRRELTHDIDRLGKRPEIKMLHHREFITERV